VTKTNNIAILIHAVALSLRGSGRLDDTRLDMPPISLRHHLRLSSCQRGDALEKKRRKLMEAWAVGSVRRRNRVRS
jgi:Ni,Fe-hydrogenase III large subunit